MPLNLCLASTLAVLVYIICHLHGFPVSTDLNSSLIPIWNHNCSNEEKGAIGKNPLCLLLIEVTLIFSCLFPSSCNILCKMKLSSFQSHTTLSSLEESVFMGSLTRTLNNKQTNKQKRQENRLIFSTSCFLQSLDLTV